MTPRQSLQNLQMLRLYKHNIGIVNIIPKEEKKAIEKMTRNHKR